MKTSKLKKIIYGIGISLFFSQGFLNIACSDWTDIEAKDYYEPPTQGYENNLKDYFNSPHKAYCMEEPPLPAQLPNQPNIILCGELK
mgnify:CR=1 FL=1